MPKIADAPFLKLESVQRSKSCEMSSTFQDDVPDRSIDKPFAVRTRIRKVGYGRYARWPSMWRR